MNASVTTDGGNATFTLGLENFTVGAPGENHLHYNLNDGGNVMVYANGSGMDNELDADGNLSFTGLPNGDHSILLFLVDANHAPLDPAVEQTIAFSTFDGTAACGETVTYTQVANGDYTVALTAPAGQEASVTINATMENNYDYIYVTDRAGNALNADQTTGSFTDAVYTSTDGTVSVNVTNDGSVQNGDVTLAFSCACLLYTSPSPRDS